MRKYKYEIVVTIKGDAHTIHTVNLLECATAINSLLGYDLLSRNILINWMCREKKSSKYDFIDIRRSMII
jgi:hypothetical protein